MSKVRQVRKTILSGKPCGNIKGKKDESNVRARRGRGGLVARHVVVIDGGGVVVVV